MGSNYFGYQNMGNDRRTDVVGGSRKGKKGGSDKPKQPQRGLGVAQLEKIRLRGQLGSSSNLHPSHHNSYHSSFNQDDISLWPAPYPSSSYFSSPSPASYNYNPHFLMGNDDEKTRCDDVQTANISSWISRTTTTSSSVLEFPQHMQQMTSAQDLLNFNMEANSQDNHNSIPSCSINNQNFDDKELDLELRLSR